MRERTFQVCHCDAEHERKVADELLKLYEKLREEHPEYRFDFIQIGLAMGTREDASKVGHA